MLAGAARLPVAEGRNALFLGTAARQVRALLRKGCPRTALEWAKMVLSLDRHDPCGMLFHIDFCALRARQCAPMLAPRTFVLRSPMHSRAVLYLLLRLCVL